MTTTRQPSGRATRRRPWLVEFYRSDVGKKYAMAISGIILLGFIFGHMVGNLHAFEGAEKLNHYGEGLRDLGEPILPRTLLLWLIRLPLALALFIHVHAAWALTRANQRARGRQGYEGARDFHAANYASRTMRWTGVIILLYLIWHLADLTWGIEAVNPEFVRGDVYGNLVASLERWPVALFYILAQGALALHVWHGAWSMFQSLGVNNPNVNRFRRSFATGFAVIVVAGFVVVPIGVQSGLIS